MVHTGLKGDLVGSETTQDGRVRELFIEELADVHGGSNPLDELRDALTNTSMACCEEGPHTCC